MPAFPDRDRSRAVAAWLFAVAALVVAMVVVGGATRLTGSGLSITEWKPVRGVLPPLSAADWAAEFRNYQRIPQYRLVNAGMTLQAFQTLFWWEWAHRFLARVLGLVFLGPLLVFLLLRRAPRRLLPHLGLITVLFACQPLVGWLMVRSGFGSGRIAVAPEWLAAHLAFALALVAACVWTGLEAISGRGRAAPASLAPWSGAAPALLLLVFCQCLMGALVAGGRAGLIDGDWPLMGGRVVPEGYIAPGQGLLGSWLHSRPAVQFDHRLVGYLVFAGALALALGLSRDRRAAPRLARSAWAVVGAVCVQIALGVLTLWAGDPFWLAMLHQLGAVGVLTMALALSWRVRRRAGA